MLQLPAQLTFSRFSINMLKITEPPLPNPLRHKGWSFYYSRVRLEQPPLTKQPLPSGISPKIEIINLLIRNCPHAFIEKFSKIFVKDVWWHCSLNISIGMYNLFCKLSNTSVMELSNKVHMDFYFRIVELLLDDTYKFQKTFSQQFITSDNLKQPIE